MLALYCQARQFSSSEMNHVVLGATVVRLRILGKAGILSLKLTRVGTVALHAQLENYCTVYSRCELRCEPISFSN
jgi:hypothetical protein